MVVNKDFLSVYPVSEIDVFKHLPDSVMISHI